MKYYRISIDELQTDVSGDVGLAWGVHKEEFQVKGRRAEKVRIRFTMTFRYVGQRWRTLLYHRDIQQFHEDGTYIPYAP
jgi:ketosteroid isomerase-like protein